MSRLIARILLAVIMFPFAAILYFGVFVFLEERLRHAGGYSPAYYLSNAIVSGSSMWLFVASYWTLVWRRSVKWTPARRIRTLLVAGVAVITGLVAGMLTGAFDSGLGAFVGSILAAMLWLLGTILAWRETDSEQMQRQSRSAVATVICPACGYNLTGLHEARCPECGARYTLNELFAAQPNRTAAELESAGNDNDDR